MYIPFGFAVTKTVDVIRSVVLGLLLRKVRPKPTGLSTAQRILFIEYSTKKHSNVMISPHNVGFL